MNDTWNRLDDLFHRLADVPAEERRRVLDAETAGDEDLRRRVEAMLASHDAGSPEVDRALDGAFADFVGDERDTGRRVGPYSLVRLIGQGGMGSVYLAERADDAYASQVAIKLIRPFASDSDAARRFRTERQILADLNHPGIARLLDGGETPDGVPYLVMEHVDGIPIDEHCARNALSLEDRLRLFLKVADALQFAHAHLVVHRDLKPGNVLVGSDGEPRLLDFGIAKLLEPDLTDGRRTRTGMRPMTPSYASPEQVRGEPVSTSSDVYSLGVLLYQVLTGRLPYPEAGNARALEDAILEHDPMPPSAVVAQAGASGRTTGRTRRDAVDVDTIVLKALSKDAARRYESAERFADDVRRFLDGLPVRARPDTWTYRAGKFVRRNRGAVAGGVTTAISVVFFGIGSAIQAWQLQQERDAAEQARAESEAVTDFLVGVFDATDPNVAQGLDLTAREILGSGSARIREELADQPGVQGRVAQAIGDAYLRLGAADSALANARFAVDRMLAAQGPNGLGYAQALDRQGVALAAMDDIDGALESLQTALDIYLDRLGPDALETAKVWNNIGSAHLARADQEQGKAAMLESLRIRSKVLGDEDPTTVTSLNNVSTLYLDLGEYDLAIDYARRALAARRAILANRPHLNLAVSLNNLASALEFAGRYGEAEPYYLESLEMRELLLEADHPAVLRVKNNLGGLYLRSGREDEAVPIFEEIVSAYVARGDSGMSLAMTLSNYGLALLRSDRPAEAIPVLRESESVIARQTGIDNPTLAFPRQSIGDGLVALGRFDEAEVQFRSALEVRREGLGPDHPSVAFSMAKLGAFLLDRGRLDDATPLLEGARSIREAVLAPDHPDRIDSLIDVARLRAASGDSVQARDMLEQAVELGEAARGAKDRQVADARRRLAELGTPG